MKSLFAIAFRLKIISKKKRERSINWQILQNNPYCCAYILSTVPCSAHPQEASGAQTETNKVCGKCQHFMIFLENLRELIIVAQVWFTMLMLCPIILYPIPTMLTVLMLWFLPTKAFWNYCWDALPLWRLETPGGAIVNINKSLMLLESAG